MFNFNSLTTLFIRVRDFKISISLSIFFFPFKIPKSSNADSSSEIVPLFSSFIKILADASYWGT
jgi:hypothetical protein